MRSGCRVEGAKEVLRSLRVLEKGILDRKTLNRRRGKGFEQFTKGSARNADLGLIHISPLTRILQGRNHPPLYFTGKLVSQIETKTSETMSETGFHRSNKAKPENSRMTYFGLAIIHAAGYRVPLQGEKGQRVRAFFAAQGIYFSATKQYLIIPPRPLILNAITRYAKRGYDERILLDYMDKLWRKAA